MYKLMRFYNQNRKTIWGLLAGILIVFVLLQLINSWSKNKTEKEQSEYEEPQTTNVQYNDISLETEKSVVSGDKVSNKQKDMIKVIDEFFKYCNEQKIQEAYDLLTEECKDELYSSLQVFYETYYKEVINGEKKNISVENWVNDTYKVKISEDFLSTGKYSEENTIQDYITIKKDDNNEYKLNINGYIERKKQDKEDNYKNINVKDLEKMVYMDYEIYTFEITNNSDNTILMDSLDDTDSMYIQDSKGVKYSAYTHELSKGNLTIDSSSKKQLKIKYYSQYQSNKKIKKIGFSKIIFNDQGYDNKYYDFEMEI